MVVVSPIITDSVPNTLRQNIAICATTLSLITNTPIEVITMTYIDPERHSALWKEIVDELGDGTVDLPHHRAKLISDPAVPKDVVVVVKQ